MTHDNDVTTDMEWSALASEEQHSTPRLIETSAQNDSADNLGSAPSHNRLLEDELDRLILRLMGDMSELAMVRLLPKAKALYEDLHPETKHGGERNDQVTKNRTWPSFAKFISKKAGLSPSTVYGKLNRAEELETLDTEAEGLCYGSSLANNIGLVVRIARIPQKELHRDVVNIYRTGGPKKAKAELLKWEELFELQPKPQPTPELDTPAEAPEGQEAGASDETPEGHHVRAIIEALGVSCIEECVPAIESLKVVSTSAGQLPPLQTPLRELKEQLAEAEARATNLSQELKLYRSTPLGKLFQVLGARDAKGAFEKARALTAACDASPQVSE